MIRARFAVAQTAILLLCFLPVDRATAQPAGAPGLVRETPPYPVETSVSQPVSDLNTTASHQEGEEAAYTDVGGLLDLDIDDLGNVDMVVPAFDVEVTSVTRNESTVGRSPAAVHVITQEMIRRSGKTSVPELLRMVPGLQVARINSNIWAISSRGFNNRFANKLLVLIDGRSVYTSTFSGVNWDVQDLVLEDIERIEVIRGPGATVWGANAVNGVINIITKRAQDTQGLMIAAGGGDQDKSINQFRYGGVTSGNVHYRVYGKHFERAAGFSPDPTGPHDDWRQGRLGFRADWGDADCQCDTATVQGELYSGAAGEHFPALPIPGPPFTAAVTGDAVVSGGHFLARWDHRIDDETNYHLQAYYDRRNRRDVFADQHVDTFDVEFQHRSLVCWHHAVTWGLGYRLVSDNHPATFPHSFSLDPVSRQTNLCSAFIQDEIELVDDELTFLVGCKFEHNGYSGFEYQPTGRLLWMLDERRAVWGAVSRAVRTPSRVAEDMRLRLLIMPPVVFGQFDGTRALEAEDLMAYEIGYRAQPTDAFSWDVTLFHNDYEDLITFLPTGPPAGFPPTVPFVFANAGSAETFGVELSCQWQPADWWRLSGWYSFISVHPADRFDPGGERMTPRNQAWLMISRDLPRGWEVDVLGRYVDTVPGADARNYISLDLRLGWRPVDRWEFSVVGQNLLDSHRGEFLYNFVNAQPTEVRRGVYAQVVFRR